MPKPNLKNDFTKKLAARIKFYRKDAQLSQTEVAIKLGIRPAAYSKIENASSSVTVERLYGIAGVLGVSVIELLGEEEKKRVTHKELYDIIIEDIAKKTIELQEKKETKQRKAAAKKN